MRRNELNEQLTLKISREQRAIVEKIATSQEVSLAGAARFLIDRGIAATGLKA